VWRPPPPSTHATIRKSRLITLSLQHAAHKSPRVDTAVWPNLAKPAYHLSTVSFPDFILYPPLRSVRWPYCQPVRLRTLRCQSDCSSATRTRRCSCLQMFKKGFFKGHPRCLWYNGDATLISGRSVLYNSLKFSVKCVIEREAGRGLFPSVCLLECGRWQVVRKRNCEKCCNFEQRNHVMLFGFGD